LPVDAGIENERTLQRDAFSLDEILSDLEGAHNKVNVVVLDACRNNPLPSSSRGTGTRGLAVIQDVPGDLFVMFSTAAGDVAADGKGKRNSPFAESFLKYVNSNEPVALMASDVINETMRLTGLQQRPFSRGSIISDKNYSLNPTRAGTTQTDLTAEDRAAAFYAEGMDRYSNQELDEAILYFSEAIRLNPKLFEAYLYRGLANDQKGSYDRAIADYSKAIDRQPNNALLYNYRGRLYTIKGNYQFALYDLDRAIFLNQKDASAYKNRGDAHYGNGSYDQAIRDYTEAIRLDPNNQDAKNNLETVRKAGH
jgi:tetratricopeptide (TPR) repeat protein